MTQKATTSKTTDSKGIATPATAVNAAVQSQSPLSPQEQLLQLHHKYGNSAVQRMYESRILQAKLKIGQPDDKYEREADSVADQVMRPEGSAPLKGGLSRTLGVSMPDPADSFQTKLERC